MEDETNRDESFLRLMQAAREFGIDSPKQLARVLGRTDQMINNWKKRGVSKEGLLLAEKRFGCSPAWIKNGDGLMQLGDVEVFEEDEKEIIYLYRQLLKPGKEKIFKDIKDEADKANAVREEILAENRYQAVSNIHRIGTPKEGGLIPAPSRKTDIKDEK